MTFLGWFTLTKVGREDSSGRCWRDKASWKPVELEGGDDGSLTKAMREEAERRVQVAEHFVSRNNKSVFVTA